MNLTEEKKIKHVAYTIAIGFIGSFLAFGFSLFFPPDFSTPIPTFPKASMVSQEISLALYILGCTVLGLKLAEEKKTLPSAGFTFLAIAMGINFILYFINLNNEQSLQDGYKTFCGMMYLLIPAMILIAFYSEFPRWVNWLGLVSLIPYIITYFKFMSNEKYSTDLDRTSFFSVILFNLTALAWGIFTLRNMKKEIAELKKVKGEK